jgi:putative transposase
MNIVFDEEDKWRFLKSLYLLNDKYADVHWHKNTARLPLFTRPNDWPKRRPLTKVLAWTLMPNHFHLILKEIEEGGASKFMQRLCGSMSMCFNSKYHTVGSIFQGSYKSRIIEDDSYLRYLIFYIHIKNVMEMFPGGLTAAMNDFDNAWLWATSYPFSSLPGYMAKSLSPIIGNDDKVFSSAHCDVISKFEAKIMLEAYLKKTDIFYEDKKFQKSFFE